MFDADYFISKLGLESHIEGGFFKEVYRSVTTISDGRGVSRNALRRCLSTTIYFLLRGCQVSKFHSLKSDEIWFYHYGSPVMIHMIDEAGSICAETLGLNPDNRESPQVLIPHGTIFAAELLDKQSFGLVSCMVSPGFCYEDFTLYEPEELISIFPQHREIIERINSVCPIHT